MKKNETMLSRRQMLKGGALAGAGLLIPWNLKTSRAVAGGITVPAAPAAPVDLVSLFPGKNLFYTAPLVASIPVAKPKNRIPGIFSYYEIKMREGSFRFHPDLPLAPTWGYDDTMGGYLGYIGPTIEARKFEQVAVKWINNLPGDPGAPFGLVDPDLVPEALKTTGGRAVVHVHGMHTVQKYDGGPEDWFVPGQSRIFYYPNIQDAASLWYHDHAIGVTRLNVYAGLAGLYLLRDGLEDSLRLPKGRYEIPLVLQDKNFWGDTNNLNLWYPNPWEAESFGNTIMVNAQLWPFLEVEPRKYRFRLYNGANARVFRLRVSDTPGGTNTVLPFNQIGAEGGFLPRAEELEVLLLANGERADVILDFSGKKGQELYLTNDAATPFDPGAPPLDFATDANVMQVMKFKVKGTAVTETSKFFPGMTLAPFTRLSEAGATRRQITLVEAPYMRGDGTDSGMMKVLLNNRQFMNMDGTISTPTETPRRGTTEVWQFINMTPDTHPMHMHLVTFEVIGRQQLTVADPGADGYLQYAYGVAGNGAPITTTGAIPPQYLTGPVMPPAPNETGRKDTVKTNPGEVTYVIAKFEHFTGKFVYHCHILDHEENDMMQYMKVVGPLGKESADDEFTEHSIMPSDYALEQNFPNPFNPETQIRFQIPDASHVSIRVFNTAGQEVATLIDADLQAGWHTANWNAANLSSGAYFYRLEAGTFSTVKKMLLLK